MDPTDDAIPHDGWVICLCAEWCGVCREWRSAFERAAAEHPGMRFAWVDVEDEAEVMGEVDVETFPTVLVAAGGQPLFFGPVVPAAGQFARLLANLLETGATPTGVSTDVRCLFQRLIRALRN
jgi:thioredoxin 1